MTGIPGQKRVRYAVGKKIKTDNSIRVLQRKGLWHCWWFHFVYNATRASLFVMRIGKLLVDDKITALYQSNLFHKHYIKRYKPQHNKNELWNTVRLISLQKPQLPSTSIFFKVVHPCVFLYILYLLILTFWAVIFMFHLIWWQFPLLNFGKFRGTAPLTCEILYKVVHEFAYWGRIYIDKVHVTYRKILKISPSDYKPLKLVTQKTLR